MNQILIGIKPNVYSREAMKDIEPIIAKLIPGDAIFMKEVLSASSELISDLYEGNQFQKECINCYSGRDWCFIALNTELPFSDLNSLKLVLREDLAAFSSPTDKIGDNSIHISDSAEAGKREIEVIRNHSPEFLTDELSPPDEAPRHVEHVDHPDHYQSGFGMEVIDVIEGFDLDFCLGNTIKYILRAGKKGRGTEVQDLEKAAWYLKRAIDRQKPKRS